MTTTAPAATTPATTYAVRRGFRHVLGRGTVGCGYYVVELLGDRAPVVAGPYTTLEQAAARAAELELIDARAAQTAAERAAGYDSREYRDAQQTVSVAVRVNAEARRAARNAEHRGADRAAGAFMDRMRTVPLGSFGRAMSAELAAAELAPVDDGPADNYGAW